MQVTVYLDIIFFTNFVVDCLVLTMVNWLLRQHVTWWRILLGGLFGAGTLLFFIPVPMLYQPVAGTVIYIGISLGATLTCFGIRRKGILVRWLSSTTIMVLMGNVMNYIRYIMKLTVLDMFSWFVCVSTAVIFIACVLGFLQRRAQKNKQIYLVQIKHGQNVLLEQCYMDTGNLLRDPYLRKPIILLSKNVVKQCLDEAENALLEQYFETGRLEYRSLLSDEIQRNLFFHEIPYKSVGMSEGKLLCFLADEVKILDCKQTMHRQPIAVGPDSLFAAGDYQGLLQPDCISI